MKQAVKIGTTGDVAFTVETQHTIAFPGEGALAVLSTPSLIWFLEHAAIEALKTVIETGEISVGTDIEVQHLAPTPAGMKVTCSARVVQADGPSVAFHVEARDEQEIIARGFHRRRILRGESFAKRLRAKAGVKEPPKG